MSGLCSLFPHVVLFLCKQQPRSVLNRWEPSCIAGECEGCWVLSHTAKMWLMKGLHNLCHWGGGKSDGVCVWLFCKVRLAERSVKGELSPGWVGLGKESCSKGQRGLHFGKSSPPQRKHFKISEQVLWGRQSRRKGKKEVSFFVVLSHIFLAYIGYHDQPGVFESPLIPWWQGASCYKANPRSLSHLWLGKIRAW